MLSYLSNKIDAIRASPPIPERVEFLTKKDYAHRGLHGGAVLENSLGAFEAAIKAGFGMECDVQSSENGMAMVFHDADLERLTDREGKVSELKSATLQNIPLKGDNGNIPTLNDLLSLLDYQEPILIEIKTGLENNVPLCLSVRRSLEGYPGKVAIMSFDPAVVRWFRRNAEHATCGLVISEEETKGFRGRIKRHMALWHAKPDFLAYDIRSLPSKFAKNQRKRGIPVLTWTVKTAEHKAKAAKHADATIFEIPQK